MSTRAQELRIAEAIVDKPSLEQLYDIHARPLYRYALALTGSREDAEDAVQEVFVRLARDKRDLERIGEPKAYLFTAVRNAVYTILRSRKRRGELESALCLEVLAEAPQAIGVDREHALAACQAMALLPVEQREVLVLKVFDDMTLREIARTVGAPLNTVASRYRYALEKLREALEADRDE